MNSRPENTAKTRECTYCRQTFPLDPAFFVRDKSRQYGFAYECRDCHSKRKIGRDRRKERWSSLNEEQKKKRKEIMQKYAKTNKGRAVMLRAAYRKIDACDMTTNEVAAIISQPCTYCQTTVEPRGLDRIDNQKPHIKGNVLPACGRCNVTRGDRFTSEEMLVIGETIRLVIMRRNETNQSRSAGHLGFSCASVSPRLETQPLTKAPKSRPI